MPSDHNSKYDVSESLRIEFIEDFQDRLPRMKACFEGAKNGSRDPLDAMQDFQRELHNIKGTGGAFGFPTLSLICHRFEECLLHLPTVMFGTSRIVSTYLKQLDEIATAEKDLSEAECKTILRSLPLLGANPERENVVNADTQEVIVVASSGTIRHKMRSELLKFGFQVTTVPDGVVALSLIMRGQPDIVIISGTVDSMPGFDLIRALVTMKSTAYIRIAALTSFELHHPEVLMLPEGIPVIQLKADLHEQISKSLTALEYRFLKNF